MLTVGLLAVLAGVVLGTHFRVLILVPAMVIACVVIAAFGAGHDTLWWAAIAMLVAVAALQTGYLVGITRALRADARAPELRTASRTPAA